MKNFTITNDYSLEFQVFLFITSKCNKKKNESVIQEYQNKNHRIRYDLYLPQGCSALNIKPKTAIEIKLRISYNTIERCKALYDNIMKEDNINDFFVIYGSAPNYDKDYTDFFYKRKYKIL